MDNFFRYFFQDIGNVFRAFVDALVAFWDFIYLLFNFPKRMDIIAQYNESFSTTEWVLLLVVNLILVALIIVLIVFLVKLFRKIFRFRISRL